jgi:dethiobiotin synthetase
MNIKGCIITGTDTGVGKTVIAAMLTLASGGLYWKPVQSGLEEETDTEFVRRVTGLGPEHFKEETYRLKEPLSPHMAARLEGVEISMTRLKSDLVPILYPHHTDNNELKRLRDRMIIVEGAGGLLVPLNGKHMMTDLFIQTGLPVVLVSRSGLGTINHTLLTIEALRSRNIKLLGVVMNGKPNPGNREAIEYYGGVDVLAEVQPVDTNDRAGLKKEGERILSAISQN